MPGSAAASGTGAGKGPAVRPLGGRPGSSNHKSEFAGLFAFGYFARRYHLTHQAPYAGFSPNAQPTPGQIAALIEAIRASGQTTLFHEELLDPKVGRTISDETGVRLALLHAAHNLSREDWMRGDVTYLSLMEGNLARLRAALDCP